MRLIVNVDVPALQPAVDFYCAALGLTHTRTLDGDVAELQGASATLYLLLADPSAPPTPAPNATRDYTRHWTPVHLDFVVDDLDAARDRALAAGAIQESDGVEWRGSRCLTFSDPFGHGFCLIAFEEETYWD